MSALLKIKAGLHRGTRLELGSGRHVLGSGLSCDVILADLLIAEQQLRFTVGVPAIRVTALAAGVFVDGAPLQAEASIDVEHAYIKVGDVEMSLRCRGQNQRMRTAAAAARPRTSLHMPTVALALLATGSVSIAFAVYHAAREPGNVAYVPTTSAASSVNPIQPPKAHIEPVDVLASDSRWRNIKADLQDGRPKLSGFVSSQADLDALLANKHMATLRPDVESVLVGGAWEARIRELVRDRGVEVAVEPDSRAILSGQQREAATAMRVKALQKELKGRLEIVDRTTYRPIEERKKVHVELPFRVAAVNLAERYFESDDGTKYFEGSALENGYRVVAIEPARIVFAVGSRQVEWAIP